MGVKQDLKELKEEMKEVKLFLNSTYVHKAKKYDELVKDMLNLRFDSVEAKKCYDALGNTCISIEYKPNPIILQFDDDGNLIENERFKTLNKLDLISQKDMNRLAYLIASVRVK